jgi:glucokinase
VTELVAVLEIGGTHVSAGRVDVARSCLDPSGIRRFVLEAGSQRDAILAAISRAALEAWRPDIARLGVAVPGPFEYERGVARFHGVSKFDSLYGVDLRDRLSRDLGLEPRQVRFTNDAHAFVLGEWWVGAAKGHARAMGVTLGTGVGSGFLANGEIVVSGAAIPPDARLDLVPFRDGAVEDLISSRGIIGSFGASLDVAEIARLAHAGDAKAVASFRAFGSALGEFLEPWLGRFGPTCLVFGGSITHSWDLFVEDFQASCPGARRLAFCGPSDRPAEAPLLGAALHAVRAHSEMG